MNNTEKSIIEAGKELFSEKGYAAVRTKEIAAMAGVNETTLFRHFGSKQKLFEQIIILSVIPIDNDNLFHSEITGVIEEDLVTISKHLFYAYESNTKLIKMIIKSIIDDSDSLSDYVSQCRGGHIRKYLHKYFKELKEKGLVSDDAGLLADIFMSCMNGYLFSTLILNDEKASTEHLEKIARKLAVIMK